MGGMLGHRRLRLELSQRLKLGQLLTSPKNQTEDLSRTIHFEIMIRIISAN
jgi:hypothetical protein